MGLVRRRALRVALTAQFTELAILYAKHRPEQLMDHLKLYHTRINMPKVIRVVEEAHLWVPLVFLYAHYQEHDNAALTMIQRSADAWDHEQFKTHIVKVSNLEIVRPRPSVV